MMMQPALIMKICETVPLTNRRKHEILADHILYEGDKPHKTSFHYRSAIRQLNYLAGSTQPELMMDVHQCIRDSVDCFTQTTVKKPLSSTERQSTS
jgi:hypothetical protein